MARLTFPDQQQDLQNAAGFSLASECDGSVKFARQAVEADFGRLATGGLQVGYGVSEATAALVTTQKPLSRCSCPW